MFFKINGDDDDDDDGKWFFILVDFLAVSTKTLQSLVYYVTMTFNWF